MEVQDNGGREATIIVRGERKLTCPFVYSFLN